MTKSKSGRKAAEGYSRVVAPLEALEDRRMMSVYTPAQIRHAYGFDQVQGDGTGQTIAIVDAFDEPNIAADLQAFDTQFGLPPAALTKVSVGGKARADSGWGVEIALDVEWAHAIAPKAKILLVEARSARTSDLLSAVDYARKQAGVSVVSMSWGGSEFSSEASYDSYFTSKNGQGITFLASSGDYGAPASWPASSSNIVAVGGTTLTLDSSGNYGGETGWSGSGGGPSLYEAAPAYQAGLGYARRANPDVAYDADSNSGFYVYDTYYSGGGGWFAVGGTSAGSPQWAGLVAVADQLRGANGSLDGLSQTLPALYGAASSGAFHDITSGNNGYAAGTGYDLVTGVGSPFANTVITALVNAPATASGASATASSSLSPSVKSGSADDPVLDAPMQPHIHVAAADVNGDGVDDVVTGHAGHHGHHGKHGDGELTQSFGLRRFIA